MRPPKISGLLCSMAALGVGLAPVACAAANSWDEFTYITFSAPVEVPGHALPAGTYLFQVADIWSNQETIEIYSADKSRLYAMVQSIPMYRYEPPPQRSVVQFAERPANTPEALAVWFPRGQRWGHRFVYPGERRAKPGTLGTRP